MTALIGASLLSAAGSLPLHLMPLIVVSLVADSRTSVAQAGWVASAVLLGQLSTSLALPALAIRTVNRNWSFAVSMALVLGLVASGLGGAASLFLGWFVVGACCGTLQYLGVVTASNDPHPTFAFSLRLGIVLVLAGAVVVALRAADVFDSYLSILSALAVVFGVVLTTGIALYHPRWTDPVSVSQVVQPNGLSREFIGLATLFLLFVAQTGFLAYVVQGAVKRGIGIEQAAWALAAMKLVTGVWLLSVARIGSKNSLRPRFLGLGLLLAVSILLVSYTSLLMGFLLGLITYEFAFNSLAARLQGNVVATAPQFTGRWLTGTMLIGAAVGPPLHGAAIGAGAGAYFIVFAAVSALLPSLWVMVSDSRFVDRTAK